MTTRDEAMSANPSRILIIDDNPSIHSDIRKILAGDESADQELAAMDMFDEGAHQTSNDLSYEIESADQGQGGLAVLRRAIAEGRPFAMAFVDMRMPPGWDGIETIQHLWKEAPDLQVVICSAYSDHSWSEIMEQLAPKDRLLILRKPFDSVEIQQLAQALTAKWRMGKQIERQVHDLEHQVDKRTTDLVIANRQLKIEAAQRVQMEIELRLAQKLEAIGQLASGIAHELNTPIQFVGDSVHFVSGACTDVLKVLDGYRDILGRVAGEHGDKAALEQAAQLETAADLSYLTSEIPLAFARISDGSQRVATIVRAMKEFAHPDMREKTQADLNTAISNTLIVARSEYKFVAQIDLALGDLPLVSCHPGDINQVFLNLIVNAAHAIQTVVGSSGSLGRIGLATRVDGPDVVVEISDTGCGIAQEIAGKVYDPFFTTKPVGTGTGQGLAIARSIIVDKHGGSINFTSQVGIGTTFVIRLPVESTAPPPS
jgi:two-component system, NtrC family, sensor kinase